jgi:hypothetical protein
MRTNLEKLDFDYMDDGYQELTDSDLMGYLRPRDIVEDPELTIARKRELLAYWASDIHAVSGAPALRSYALGVATSIDDIFAALRQLDEMIEPGATQPGRQSLPA